MYVHGNLNPIFVAHLLELEVGAGVFEFLRQGNKIVSRSHIPAEYTRENPDHLRRLLGFSRTRIHSYRLQGVVEKVRIDLHLEGLNLSSLLFQGELLIGEFGT
jgi:hypothetical protein